MNYWDLKDTIEEFAHKTPDPRVLNSVSLLDQNPSDTTIIDAGAGAGRHAAYLADKGYRVLACDNNKSMVSYLEKKLGRENVEYFNVTKLGYPNEIAHLIICLGVLHHLTSIRLYRKAVSELHRVLAPRGVLELNVFTSKVIDENYTVVGRNPYRCLTKEGLEMMLLSSREVNRLFVEQGFERLDHIEELSPQNTGPRSVYRAKYLKT